MTRQFKVEAVVDAANNVPQSAVVTIDAKRDFFSVRVKRGKRSYTLPLSRVVTMVAQRVMVAEACRG